MALPTVTAADADLYFQNTLRNDAWVALTNNDVVLAEAQNWLGQLCFNEDADCCGRSFEEAYVQAVSELALALAQNPSAILGGGSTQTIKSAQLGSMSVTYADGDSGRRYGHNAPKVLQAFPWLGDILGCWLKIHAGSARVLHRECVSTRNGVYY